MKYLKIILIAVVLISASQAANRLIVNDTTISSGDTVWVTIDMENDDGVVSFQFDLDSPETLIYSGVAELSERAVDHELYLSTSGGVLRVMALSNTLTAFAGNSETLVTLGFTTSLENGIFDFELINPILGDHNSENILTGYENGTITIEQTDYDGPVWHVSSTGLDSNFGYEESPFSTIQHGIDRSTDFDTVIVHPGIYFENINFNGKNVVVSSLEITTSDTSYISATIIDGNSSGSVVTIRSGETNACVLNGFVIRNGLSFGGDGLNDGYGGGIFINNYSSPILDNLIVEDNESNHEGGGILVDLSNPVIRNSIIRRNSSGGIAIIAMSNPLIEGCIVKGNIDSWGAGIKISGDGGSTEIRHTVISENIAETYGGGLYASGTMANPSTVNLVNVTIVNNEASTIGGGGILGAMESEINLVNSILWGNQPDQIFQNHASSIVNVDYSDIQDGYEGESNLNIDPLFNTSPVQADYLTGNSPCIDTGDPDLDNDGYYWAVDFDDQDEDGTRLDIGAFSFFQDDLNPEDNSIAFDGIDDYVIVPNEYGPSNIGQNRTIAAWVRPEDLSPRPLSSGATGEIAYAVALTQQITASYSGAHWGGIGIELSENPKFQAIGYSGPPLYIVASGTTTPIIGEWYHLALVFDGNDLRLFVNGLEEGSQSFTGFYPTSTGGDAALVIGSHLANQEFNYTFPGLIDNVQLWNRALQPSELRSLVSSAPSDSVDTDQIGHWALNEGSDTFISDESGSEFVTDGTLSGGSWSHLNSTPIEYRSRYNVATTGSNETGDGSEDFPFATIQYGINSSLNGDTVLVQPGTHTENINFIGKNISVGSLALTTNDTSYISQTIIDGSESGSVVIFSSSEDSTSILNGFTIRNGSAPAGGGVYCDASSPSLVNLRIISNTALNYGGGVYNNHSAHPIFESCEIINNTAGVGGGIECQNNSGITLVNANVDDNQVTEYGGGVLMNGGILSATNTSFNGNIVEHEINGAGGGVYLNGDGDFSFLNCSIQGNTVHYRGGGIYCNGASPLLTNVLITDNRVTSADGSGSGVYGLGGSVSTNVTIANNWSPSGLVVNGAEEAIFINSIIWHNSPASSSRIMATYSNIENNGLPSVGNLKTDPLFVDMYNQDYHLSDSSPCIGSGDSSVVLAIDLDGNPRPDPEGSAPDMGAYESPLSVRETGNTYFVSTTGSDTTFGGLIDPFSTISRGVEAAWNGDTVIVFPGVYEENLFISNMSIVLGSQMLLTGDTNYVNITKINGGIIFDEGVDSTALLSGFTIQNSTTGIACVGDPTLSHLRVQDHSSNGITFSGSDASLSHIRLTRNGRGIEGTDSDLALFDIIVNQNSTTEDGAGINLIGCIAVMDSVEITNNVSTNGFGGGMYINSSTITLSRSKIDRNRSDNRDGGGIYFTTNSSITMENVSVSENYADEYGGGLYIGRDINSSFLASNISINSNECNEYGAGIYIRGVNDFTLSESRIQGNTAIRRGGGIYCWDAHPELINVLITDNEVTGTGTDDGGGGLYLIESNADPILTNVTIVNNNANEGGGIYISEGVREPSVANSIIWYNSPDNYNVPSRVTSTYSNLEGGLDGVGNINCIPLFADIYNSDYHLSDNSNCIGSGTSEGAPTNDLDGNIRPDPPGSAPDMGAYENSLAERISGNIYYVSTTGSDSSFGGLSDPFLTIQHGVNASWNGDTLLVMPGIYQGNITFNGKSLVLASLLLPTGDTSYVSNTIIEGSIYLVSGVDSTAELSGFTVQNSDVGILCTGDPSLNNLRIIGNTLAGIIISGANVSISNTLIISNGQGIDANNSELFLSNVTIAQNTTNENGAGIAFVSGSLIMDSVLVVDNTTIGLGGGLYVENSTATMTNSNLEGNISQDGSGGGMFTSISSGTLSNCIVRGNSAFSSGGGLLIQSSPEAWVLDNVLIATNTTEGIGGGYWHNGGSSILTNCTIANNTANENAGGYVGVYGANTVFENCILAHNIPQQVYLYPDGESSVATFSYTDIEGGQEGIITNDNGTVNWLSGNLNLDPLFIDPLASDFHLQNSSPCIDAGNPDLNNNGSIWETDPDDQDPDGTQMDIGAYYFHQIPQNEYDAWYVSTEGSDEDGNGSLALPYLTIQQAVSACSILDTVILLPGDYESQIVFPEFPITIRSYEGFQSTSILGSNGDFLNSTTSTICQSTVQGITFEGFSVIANYVHYLPRFVECKFSNNEINHGIFNVLPGDSVAQFEYCIFVQNAAIPNFTDELFVGNGFSLNFTNCSFASNSNGLFILDNGGVTFTNCIVKTSLGAIYNTSKQANYSFLKYPDEFNSSSKYECIEGGNPGFSAEEDGILRLIPNSICIDRGDPLVLDPDGTRSDMGALYFDQDSSYVGTRWYVSPEGDNWLGSGNLDAPFESILQADNFASPGDSVILLDGVHTRSIHTRTDSLAFTSMFLSDGDSSHITNTIIDGEMTRNLIEISKPSISINGLTLQNGFFNGSALGSGGIYLNSETENARITNCRIIGNGTGDEVTLAGGGIISFSPSLEISNCHFENNYAHAAGGALVVRFPGVVEINNSEFVNNHSNGVGGAILLTDGEVSVDHCVFYDNTAGEHGHAIYAGDHSTVISDFSTFSNNGSIAGSIALNDGSILDINNSILWGTPNYQLTVLDDGDPCTISIDYTDIMNGSLGIDDQSAGVTLDYGEGNLNQLPEFTSESDHSLQPTSPCIDAGDPNSPLDPDNTRADMGAYYFDRLINAPQISISPDSLEFMVNTVESFELSQTLTISNIGATPLEASIIINSSSVTDIDGNIYPTVQVGDQIWMAENLKVTHYQDGTPVSHVADGTAWGTLTGEAYCIINNNSENEVDTYGALYNWFAVEDSRNIAPAGWHVPTDDDWKELEMALGMSQSDADGVGYRGTDEGSKLAGRPDLWNDGGLESNVEFGTSSFAALPSGYRNPPNGQYSLLGGLAYFWSATERLGDNAWTRTLNHDNTDVYRNYGNLGNGFAIRCIKDIAANQVDGSEKQSDRMKNRNYVIQKRTGPNSETRRDNDDSWITINQTSLSIQPGTSAEVSVSVNAEGLEVGDYSDLITIFSNDNTNGRIEVPVAMVVISQDQIPPDVHLNTPDITELIENGDTLTVTWTASDNVALDWAKLFFTSNAGASFSLYDSVDANLGEIEWIAPNVISNECNFAIWVSDLAGNISADTLNGTFFIDDGTVPSISILNPTNVTSVKEGDTLLVTWEAADNVGIEHFEFFYSNEPIESFQLLDVIPSDTSTYYLLMDFGFSDSARIKMIVLDLAGNSSDDVSDYFSITDNTPPRISNFLIPDTTEWGIGSRMDISVFATDNVEITGLDLNYSLDDGSSWLPIVESLYPVAGRPTYSWLIPDIPGECRVQAIVSDAVGLTDTRISEMFTVVIEYPQLVGTLPQIKPNMDMQLRFSQSMESDDLTSGTQVFGTVGGEYELELEIIGKDVFLSAVDGFVSLDTLMLIFSASEWTNSFGYGLDGNGNGTFEGSPDDNDTSFVMVSAAGDFDQNGLLDFDDFNNFVIAWTNGVSKYELYPHQGTVPFINIQPDSSFDVYDLATFASMWNWLAGISLSAPLTETFPVEEFVSEQNGNVLTVSLNNDEYIASQTIVKYDPQLVSISIANPNLNKVSSSQLSMVNVNPDSGFIMITSSQINGELQEPLQLQLEPITRQRYSIEIAVQSSDEHSELTRTKSDISVLPIPTTFSLSQNYPNPFNASTTIEYGLPKSSEMNISVYDIRGRFVREINSGHQLAGYHVTQWNGDNDKGRNVSSGLYFIVLCTPEYRIARKALILK